MWRLDDPQCNEAAKVKYDIVRFTRGRGLDIGCGNFKAYKHFIGVDNGHHWGTGGADIVTDATDLGMFGNQSMDFVFSAHNLEHIEDTQKALKEWWRVIKPGGYLVLYLPHKDLYPNIGQPGANPDHKHDFSTFDIIEHMDSIGSWDLVINEVRDYDNGPGERGNEYSFLQVYKKLTQKKTQNHSWANPPHEKRVAVVRYGGFGDMIQTSSILPALKRDGFHVTMITTPRGEEILRHDPNVDEFWLQDTDQVPNVELGPFWKSLSKYFDRFINLSESVEGTLLALPERILYGYPDELRRQICDVNYLERTHEIAQVPFKPEPKFYATDEEKKWAQAQRDVIGKDKMIVMWSLSGSSEHKKSPWVDYVIARLLVTYADNIHIIMVGDHFCQLLEGGFENEPRVWARSGKWDIRQSLVFAQEQADIVVGPETGLLNAVGFEQTDKVLMLSHSSHNNLSRDWVNTTVIEPACDCHPCHKMHYGKGDCPWVEIPREYWEEVADELPGPPEAPACSIVIGIDQIYAAIRDCLRKREQKVA